MTDGNNLGGINPEDLAAFLRQFMSSMPSGGETGVNWTLASKQAREIAAKDSIAISDKSRKQIADAVSIGTLWLNQATVIAELTIEPKLLSRELWVADAMALYQSLATPVATRMGEALSTNFSQNIPPELASLIGSASQALKSAGSALFAMQLGQALGKLSSEVLSGGDIGLPIFQEQRAAFVPQNLAVFAASLDVEIDQAYIYLAVREMAHARLFKQSKWLREHVVSQIAKYASEITIDGGRIGELAEGFDPNNPEDVRRIIDSGALIAERTEDQERALAQIETTLALIEGWVDAVTSDATKLLPKAAAISEAMRRRRATSGPAEQTFQALLGLELRPRKLREAAHMWQAVGTEFGIEHRDSLWNHPDLLPTATDISNPAAFIERLKASSGSDALDDELKKLLGD